MAHTANKEKTTEGAAPEISTAPVTGESNPPTVDADAIKAAAEQEAAEIIAKAKAQAAGIIDEAEKTAAETANASAEADSAPKTVRMRLFKDNGKYKDDLFVAVNGKAVKIQRGVDVDIPIEYIEVIESSLKQDGETAELIERESGTYKKISASM